MAGSRQLTSADIIRSHWMPQEAVHRCCNPLCTARLEAARKHQCFCCGNVFCSQCASQTMPLDPGSAQFALGGIPAPVCALCLDRAREDGAPAAECLLQAPSQPKEACTSLNKEVAHANGAAAAPSNGSHQVASLEAVGAAMRLQGTSEAAEAPTSSSRLSDSMEQAESRLQEWGTSAAAGVALRSCSPKDSMSKSRQQPSEGSDAATPSSLRGDLARASSEGATSKVAVHSSRAAALERATSRVERKGKASRVIELYDELLTGEIEHEGAQFDNEQDVLSGGDSTIALNAASRRPSSTNAAILSANPPPPVPPLLSRPASSSWLWTSLLGKPSKADPKVWEAKLSEMTSEVNALRGEVTTAEEQAVTAQAALNHLDGLLRSATLAEYLVVRTQWQSDTLSGMPSASGCEGEWLLRFLVLHDTTLAYYFRATDPRPQGTIPLADVVEAGPLSSGASTVHGFFVTTSDGLQLQCATTNKFKVELWLTSLSEGLCQPSKTGLPP